MLLLRINLSVQCEKSTLTLCTPLSDLSSKEPLSFLEHFCCNMYVFLRDCYCSKSGDNETRCRPVKKHACEVKVHKSHVFRYTFCVIKSACMHH